jgi:hypothetical protein
MAPRGSLGLRKTDALQKRIRAKIATRAFGKLCCWLRNMYNSGDWNGDATESRCVSSHGLQKPAKGCFDLDDAGCPCFSTMYVYWAGQGLGREYGGEVGHLDSPWSGRAEESI